MKSSVRSVQRWHDDWQLPVHKLHPGNPKSPVFAYQDDLDRWLQRIARQGVGVESDRQLALIKDSREKALEIQQRLAFLRTNKLRRKTMTGLEQVRQNRFKFMLIDLDVGLTLAKIAGNASDSRKRTRNEATAHRALDTVLHLFSESELSDHERKVIEGKIAELRAALIRLGSQATQ